MKKVLVAAVVCFTLFSCEKKDANQLATEQYVKTNGEAIAGLAMYGQNDNKIKIEITDWNPVAIDSITKADLYSVEIKKRIKAANQFKERTVIQDSLDIIRYHKSLAESMVETQEFYDDLLLRAQEKLEAHKAQHQKLVDQINDIKALAEGENGNEVVYRIYNFTETITFVQPAIDEKVEKLLNSYSYINANGQVVWVDEDAESFTPEYDKLPAIYQTATEEESEEELL